MRKKEKAISLVILLSVMISLKVSSQTLSGQAKIGVMTLGPYQEELYSAFGHSAIHVNDPVNGWNLIYNYGVFDFDQPNFYLNFARGKLYYQLAVQSYDRFIRSYIRDNRRIVEQELALDSVERQALFDFLQWNAQPENRYYYYNYIYDNCATKIRDVLDIVFDNQISYDYSYVSSDLTFRDLMDLYLYDQPWGDLGIDICLGVGIDSVASAYHYMYLPDYIELGLEKATINRSDSISPLIKSTKVLYVPKPEAPRASTITPQIVFILVFFLFGFISFKDVKKQVRSNWVDVLLFTTVGMVGWLLLFLWFLTDHISEYNFNLLWAFPLHLPVAFAMLSKNRPGYLKYYFGINAVLLGALIIFWGFWPQNLHDSLIPLALLLLIRSILIYRKP